MTQLNSIETAGERGYETPTFDPRSAFSWTLRSGEMVRLGLLSRQPRHADPSAHENNEPRFTQRARGAERQFDTPTFDPRSAFSWTLRGGEMARRERRLRAGARVDLLVHAT